MVQWLEVCTSTAGGIDSLSGQGTKIPQTTRHDQKNSGENSILEWNKSKNFITNFGGKVQELAMALGSWTFHRNGSYLYNTL